MSSGYDALTDDAKKNADYASTSNAKAEPGTSGLVEVINVQPRPQPWNSGLCDCSNPVTCLCSAFCTCCYASGLSHRMEENIFVPCCLGGLATMRTKLRIKDNIEGSLLEDAVCSFVCPPCVLCQMGNEMDDDKYPRVFCGLC